MALNFKASVDAWNCTTILWLRRIAYDRSGRRHRTLYTYLLSAWWHGFFLGYYLTFITASLFTVAGRVSRRFLRYRFVSNKYRKFGYDVVTFLCTKIALYYCTYPFVVMSFYSGWRLFTELYFSMHIFALIVIFAFPLLLNPEHKDREREKTE